MSHLSLEERLARINNLIRPWPDFPKKGILFRDIFPLTKNMEVFNDCIAIMTEYIKTTCKDVHAIVGLEARGFIFGPPIAQQLDVAFIPIRKSGKLPGPTVKIPYSLEYGKDEFEIQTDALSAGQKIVIVDDLLATGGTLEAACKLMELIKVDVIEYVVLIELTDLKGRDKVKGKVKSFLSYGGE